MASVTQTAVHTSDSLIETVCAFRWKTPRSKASIARTKRLKAIHNKIVFDIQLPSASKHDRWFFLEPITQVATDSDFVLPIWKERKKRKEGKENRCERRLLPFLPSFLSVPDDTTCSILQDR